MLKLLLFLLLGILIGRIRKQIFKRTIEIDYGFRGIEKEVPYLIRWTLFKCPWFSLKLHKILISDPADPHDHPWNYTSLILWGGYWEKNHFPNKLKRDYSNNKWYKWYGPLSLLYRKGDKLHRLTIPSGKFCISLVLTTKPWRDWGFLKNNKWVNHKEVIDQPAYINKPVGTQATIPHTDQTKEKITSFMRQKRLGPEDYRNNPYL